MTAVGRSLVTGFDHVWSRFTTRLCGLDDDEYFWEPVAGCWTVRIGADGQWRLDGDGRGAPSEPAPVTTIAWRIGHLGASTLEGFADRLFDNHSAARRDLDVASHASDAIELLERQFARWRGGMMALDDAALRQPLGTGWGPYSDSTVTDLALHVFDEVVHHAAEIALLRDLYRYRGDSAAIRQRIDAS